MMSYRSAERRRDQDGLSTVAAYGASGEDAGPLCRGITIQATPSSAADKDEECVVEGPY